jgi:hypothetical protein
MCALTVRESLNHSALKGEVLRRSQDKKRQPLHFCNVRVTSVTCAQSLFRGTV